MTRFNLPSAADEAPIEVEMAQARILAAIEPLESEAIGIDASALGRTLASDLVAVRDVPGFRASAMDGYAIRRSDVGSPGDALDVVADVLAGASPFELLPRTAVRIMTGGAVPVGADTVVPVEWTDEGTHRVSFTRLPRKGANVRPLDEDMSAGRVVLRSGDVIDAPSLGVLASLGLTRTAAVRRPRVAIVSTGDELIEPGDPITPGRIVNSNRPMLAAMVAAAGCTLVSGSAIVRDDDSRRDDILRALASEADLILTTGAVSVGTRDWIRESLDRVDAERLFWRIAMKPGKPIVAAMIRTSLFIGLPGNPVSAFVGFHLFAAPAIRKLAGRRDQLSPRLRGVCGGAVPATGDRREFLRARVVVSAGELKADILDSRSSAALSRAVGCNALADRQPQSAALATGDPIDLILIDAIPHMEAPA